ncbi:MAG TPA: helix-turn-helix transcriptional regulator [Pyrinomonadaceae bacterium]|jgi:transcriptional regulator with XRE-family HTH domain|nr:helix-turn-helix transcriptional regulator [Pyrinomonadaceae bacterium]
MGRKARIRPERLADKLRQIRNTLGLSQSDMLWRLGYGEVLNLGRMSDYEQGKSEPPLPVLLEYARAANVSVETLIDDELDLPEDLPSAVKHEGITRKPISRARKR